jgi:16S rRNA (guanine(527)-N(7))-methyltransferase RsmG
VSHLEVLETELRTFQLDLPSQQKLLLARYCDELAHWNKRMNLTALSGSSLVRRLVVEPTWIALQLKPAGVLADIGSGNGSPAIPFHAVSQFKETHLIEARTKRAVFLRHLATSLQLHGLTVHRGRFEDVVPSLGPVDWVTLQGIALSEELVETMRAQPSRKETTNVVWITSKTSRVSLKPAAELEVPITGTKVFLFQLDQS